MKQLAKFTIRPQEQDFVLSLADEAGEVAEFAASPEQLDALIDALDDLLSENEEDIFEVDERRADS